VSGSGSDRSQVPVLRRPEAPATRGHLTSPGYWLAPLRRTSRPLLAVLWAVTAFFIVLSFAPSSSARSLVPALDRTFPAELWGLSEDRAIPELYGYAMQAVIVVVLVVLAARAHRNVFLAWGAVYLVVLLDDALRLHEEGSHWLARTFPTGIGSVLREDLGELVVWAGLGLVPLVAVAVTHLRAAPEDRAVSRTIAVLFGLLLFCAIVLDVVHATLGYGLLGWVLAAAEDGGELLTLGLTLAFLVGLARRETAGGAHRA
jgi:hypothetical protein